MLSCSRCSLQFPTSIPRWRCDCGAWLTLASPGMFSPRNLSRRSPTLWRYSEALGIENLDHVVSIGEGFTPLVRGRLNALNVHFKADFVCPTGSFKDRGSTVMISKLREWGVPAVVEDSSGNAGASVAAYAGIAGISARIFVPASTSVGKTAQIEMYGAELVRVPGSREDTTAAALEAADSDFYASHNWSPYFLAGMKTAAYEIAEQLEWSAPDWVVVPTGGGSLLAGLHLGFCELRQAGIIRSIPRLAAVQADACDPIHRAWRDGLSNIPVVEKQPTAAEGISVAQPIRDRLILDAVRSSQGVVCTVTDAEIWSAFEAVGRQGLYVEPTSAAAPAAVTRLYQQGVIRAGDRIVVMLTGSGLKATDKIVEYRRQMAEALPV